MRRAATQPQDWTTRPERGTVPAIRLFAGLARRVGRPAARLLLAPICAYFLIFSPAAGAVSSDYLQRILGRAPTIRDRWRHFHCFAACLLDRIFLLNGRADLLDITVHGEEIVTAHRAGCLLFGAHIGSFEVLRTLGNRHPDAQVCLVMYEANAQKTRAVLNAINPALAINIIGLGQPGAMLAVKARLDEAHFVGLLPDRTLDGGERKQLPFLGTLAWFPTGPFRMAVLLKHPVVLMLGLYRGGRAYDVHFEILAEPADLAAENAVDTMMRRYAARLEYYCKRAPYNWFNFYHFWA